MEATPSQDDWSRVQHHAARVRKLTIYKLSSFKIDQRFYELFLDHPGPALLPGLMELACEDVNDDLHDVYTKLFVQPTLRVIQWLINPYNSMSIEKRYEDILVSLQNTTFPVLDKLELTRLDSFDSDRLEPGGPTNIASEAMLNLFSAKLSMQELKHLALVIDFVDLESMKAIASLPKLESLHFFTRALRADQIAEAKLYFLDKFPALKSLHLESLSADFSALIPCLDIIPPSSHTLQLLRLQSELPLANDRQQEISPRELLRAVAPFRALQVLSVVSAASFGLGPPGVAPLDGSALKPLFALHKLSELALGDIPLVLASSDIEDMARAWPKLQILRLGNISSSEVLQRIADRVRLTVQDLLPFALHCPRIELIAVIMRYPDSPTAITSLAPRREVLTKSRLRYLFLRGVNEFVLDPAMAAFLAATFPDVQIKNGSGYVSGEMQELKAMIESFVEQGH